MKKSLERVITEDRIEKLKAKGVLIFDVDDTLLARRYGSTAKGETFADSRAARLLPDLIRGGMRVALMTGHGAEQLDERLVDPLLRKLSEADMPLGDRFFAYANRGATRINFDSGTWQLDNEYAKTFRFPPEEMKALTALLAELATTFAVYTDDVKIESREDSILSLRTVAKQIPQWESVRAGLVAFGRRQLSEKGLESRLQIAAAGKNSIEIASVKASKTYACDDLFERVAAMVGLTSTDVRTASIYIGDEFESGGNDNEVAVAFSDLECISVMQNRDPESVENITHLDSGDGSWGPEVTRSIITSILKVLD